MIGSREFSIARLAESAKTALGFDRGSVCVDGRIINWTSGVIQSQCAGLVRAGVRIQIGQRASLRVRWPIGEKRCCAVGQQVVATIPAEAVRLEAGMFRRGKQRWNRWIGRIVLVESGTEGMVYTVKIHGEDWTLKSHGSVVGAREPSKTWDVVNVVVDPQRVDFGIVEMKPWPQEAESVLDA